MSIAGGGGVIRRSSAAFCSAMPVLLSVSLLLLSYRSLLHIAATRVASVLDRDPDVRSLLSRLPSSSSSSSPPQAGDEAHRRADRSHRGPGSPRRPRARPPFLHLTRIGTLDDDYFSDADYAAVDRPLHLHQGRPFNSTFFTSPSRSLHLLGAGGDVRRPDGHRIRVLDPPASPVLFVLSEKDVDGGGDGGAEEGERSAGAEMEIRIFGQGFHLGRRDAVVLAYLMTLFSLVYFFATVGFLSCYSCAAGIVFVAMADFLLGHPHRSFLKTLCAGCRLGFRRILSFVFLRWVVRDALAQFLCILFFSDVGNQQSALKLFVRVKLMPFSLTASPLTQWTRGDEGSLWWFLLVWGSLDRVVALVFAYSCWVAVTDHNQRRRGPDVVWEGFRLILTMMDRAFLLRQVEMMICWNSGRWVLTAIGGPAFAAIVQSVAEVYFMVVWLMCYFDMRGRVGELAGGRFGRRNLEDCINDLG